MSTCSDAVQPTHAPLEAFTGSIVPTKTGLLYRAGLAVVAFAMVLLPLIYLALIVLTAWAVWLHLRYDLWLFSGASGRGGFIRLIVYLGPAIAGGILIFFMVKPFFAAKAKATQPITLDPAKEPLLFAFVQKICGLVGASSPSRIDVDCQANASAGLRSGLWSRDLVLTIGLPLVSGLEMRQFAGVLAHEFGHFAQGVGMRLTYVIRKINFWFARVVYERDAWDVKLEQASQGTDWRLAIVLHAARGCVWLTRRILWALMHAGHAISCFMLRQMEYDADSYETKVAGSDAFESTASRLRVLNVATQIAYSDVQQSWTSHRLPNNLPLLIDHKATSLPDDVQHKLATAAAAEKTGWFDTHPCDADRIRAARALNEPGVFRLSLPATGLFSNFAALSQAVTCHHYEHEFELKFTEQNLMSGEEILRESAANTEADVMCRKYFGSVNISLSPLFIDVDLAPVESEPEIRAQWLEARQRTENLRAAAEKISAQCLELEGRSVDANSAFHLTKAGFRLNPREFGLPESATSVGEQELTASVVVEETSAAIKQQLTQLEPFLAALRQRVTLALRWGLANQNAFSSDASREIGQLTRLLAAVGAEMPKAHAIGSKLPSFTLLAQNRANHSNPADVDKVALQIRTDLQSLVRGIQDRLEQFSYPFAHARGPLTVAAYARSHEPAEDEWQRTYADSKAHVDSLFPLNFRLTGKILAYANAAEALLDSGEPREEL